MTLNNLMQKVIKWYPDSIIADCWDPEMECVVRASGDMLAELVVAATRTTFDATATDKHQLLRAARVFHQAKLALSRVERGLRAEAAFIESEKT